MALRRQLPIAFGLVALGAGIAWLIHAPADDTRDGTPEPAGPPPVARPAAHVAAADSAAAATSPLPHAAVDAGPTLDDVVAAARSDTAEAARLFTRLCRDAPSSTRERGDAVVAALLRAGDHAAAVRFALAAAPAGGGDERAHWLRAAFESWARIAPEAAAVAALGLSEPGLRVEMLFDVVNPWVRTDPGGAIAFIGQLPPEWDRRSIVARALTAWVGADPAGAAAWLERAGPDADLDAGRAALALHPSMISRQPDAALAWAGQIVDADLRARTLREVVFQLARTDPEGAIRAADTIGEALLDDVTPEPPPAGTPDR